MAGLSIARRRKAWLRGVAYGAAGIGARCTITQMKLKEIYNRAVGYGRMNMDLPYVKAVVAQFKAKYPRKAARMGHVRAISSHNRRFDARNSWMR